MNKLKGFTLVELIAVIAVILILVAIVVPRIGDLRNSANTAKANSDVAVVQHAIEQGLVSGLIPSGESSANVITDLQGSVTNDGAVYGPFLGDMSKSTAKVNGTYPNFTVSAN